MSYIRNIYNPEGLYIFGNFKGQIEFHQGSDFLGTIPTETFDKLIDTYVENGYEECAVKYSFSDCVASIKEVIDKEGVKILLTYSGVKPMEVVMWDVTWYYIARSNYGRSKPHWKLRLMRRLFGNWI